MKPAKIHTLSLGKSRQYFFQVKQYLFGLQFGNRYISCTILIFSFTKERRTWLFLDDNNALFAV
jgi:hypothetical protein